MPLRSYRRLLLLCTTLCLFPLAGQGQDTIPQGVRVGLTYDPSTRPGVFVTAVSGEAGDSVRAILARDLDFGDRLNVISADAGPPPTGRFNYELYFKLGASAIVQASVSRTGSLHVAVHDVTAKRVLNVGDFAFNGAAPLSAGWRMAVHRASDEVERWITSVRGIAATRVVYVRDQRLWIVDSDGANLTPVGIGGTALSPAWHPTARYIAYTAMADDGLSVVVRDLQTGQGRRMPRLGGSNFTPTFSPDGGTLVYSAGDDGTDLYAVSAFGGGEQPRRVTFGRGTPTSSPTFSPDGRKIAYISGRPGHPEVYITDADGTNAELLTEAPSGDRPYRSDPDWSPDGRAVAFTSQEGPNLQVMVISMRDRRIKQLTGDARNENPSWAPDARHVVFTSTRSGAKQLWVLDTESGRTRQLTRGAGVARQAAWSPRMEQP
ncbi:MAG: PD40 domain-containing protein [Gemmatimonadetes bacterium]|nr:PD40 domain-containing protein [Gemmatimonadota bacterium]